MAGSNEAVELDGTWEMVAGEKGNGAPETSVWRARMVVEAGAFSLRAGADVLLGAFCPLPARGPGHVDGVVAEGRLRGMIVLGLYAMDGCRLRACFAAPGKPRPGDFGAGELLLVWEAITEMVRPPRRARRGRP